MLTHSLDLSDIQPINIKYSRFSHSLDKIFRGQSLEDLQNKIKNKMYNNDPGNNNLFKLSKKLEIATEKLTVLPPIQVSPQIIGNFDIDNLRKKTSENQSIKTNKPKTDRKNKNSDDNNKQIQLNSDNLNNPEPGKYNPNYASVYKNIPTFVFKNHNSDNNFIEKVKKTEDDKMKILISKLEAKRIKKEISGIKKENSISRTLESISIHNSKTIQTDPNLNNSLSRILKTNNNGMPSISLSKGSKVQIKNKLKGIISFDKYSSRKDIFMNKKWDAGVLTYLEPNDMLKENKKVFNLSKMKSRESNFETANSNPSVCYYNPKFNYMDKNVASFPFHKNALEKNKKFIMIQKLWRSYDVSTDYKTVHLETVIDNKNDNDK